jgi:hypothetical protein
MLCQRAILVPLLTLIVSSLPLPTRARKEQQVSIQDRPLRISTTRVNRPDGKIAFKLTA